MLQLIMFDPILVLLVNFLGFHMVYTLECFHCYVKPPPRSPFAPSPEFEPLCSQFDGSENFLVNCSQSTFCMTRTYRLKLRKGSPDVVIRERGCAKQVYSYQSLDRGQWRTVTTVMEETYSSGCVEDREWAGQLATDTQWCYCDTDRCNDANDDGDENVDGDNDTDIEEDLPQYSDYQHNFIEGGGLKISSQSVSEMNFYNLSQNANFNNRTTEKSKAPSNRVQFVLVATILSLFTIIVL